MLFTGIDRMQLIILKEVERLFFTYICVQLTRHFKRIKLTNKCCVLSVTGFVIKVIT